MFDEDVGAIAHRKRSDEWTAWFQRYRDDIADDRRRRGKRVDSAKERQLVELEKEGSEVWVSEVIEQIKEGND